MVPTDYIGDALKRRGLRDYVLRASILEVKGKPEVRMALDDALAAWIAAQSNDRGKRREKPHD